MICMPYLVWSIVLEISNEITKNQTHDFERKPTYNNQWKKWENDSSKTDKVYE